MAAFGSNVGKILFGSQSPTQISGSWPIEKTGYFKWTVQPRGYNPQWIIIHHSFSADGVTRDWDAIRRYHKSFRYAGEIITEERYKELWDAGKRVGLEMPWRDIGYHFGIEEVGDKIEIQNGRAIGDVGSHCLGFNSRSIGICVIGNFDPEPPSAEKLFWTASLCRQLMLEFKIPREQVIGHRESYGLLTPPQPVQKTCPGKMFDMDKLRAMLRSTPETRVI